MKISTKKFLLPLYHAKSLKSNSLTPESYSAPATVKFYTLSNFERANKLESWKAPNFYKKAGKVLLLKKTHF